MYTWREIAIFCSVSVELRLELLEVLRRPQLRVGLGDREEAPDRLREQVLGLGLLLDALRLLRAVRAFVTSSKVARSCAA